MDTNAGNVILTAAQVIGGHIFVSDATNDLVMPPASAIYDALYVDEYIDLPGTTAAASPWFANDGFNYTSFNFWVHNRHGGAVTTSVLNSTTAVVDAVASCTVQNAQVIADDQSVQFVCILKLPRNSVTQPARSIEVIQLDHA